MAMTQIQKLVNSVKGVHDLSLNTSLGREGHGQQVAPGRHQATVCKSTTRRRIATWNVKTLHQLATLENKNRKWTGWHLTY